MFSDKSKAVNAEWKIETLRQGKKHIADFMIEFEVLTIKAKTDDMYVIFLLKNDTRISTNSNTKNTQRIEDGNYLS